MDRLDDADVIFASDGCQGQRVLAGHEHRQRHTDVGDAAALPDESDETEISPIQFGGNDVRVRIIVPALQNDAKAGVAALRIDVCDGQRIGD